MGKRRRRPPGAIDRPVAWIVAMSQPGYGGMRVSRSVEDAALAVVGRQHSPGVALALKRACRDGLLRPTNPRTLPLRYVATPSGDDALLRQVARTV